MGTSFPILKITGNSPQNLSEVMNQVTQGTSSSAPPSPKSARLKKVRSRIIKGQELDSQSGNVLRSSKIKLQDNEKITGWMFECGDI